MSDDIARLVRFCTVGGVVAIVYIALYTGLYYNGFTPFNANAVAFTTAVFFQYIGQTCWTFRRPLWDGQQSVRFFATIGLGMIYSSIVASVVGPVLNWAPWFAAGLVAVTLPFINYISFRLWVYRPVPSPKEE